MPDIFLSYSRDDQAIARRFAESFEREGLSVWWDATLNPGEAYDKVTEKALEEARAVVVLWSKKSVDSRWVRAEATQANNAGTLVPVMIEACKRPIMFELTHTSDLSHWKGNPEDPAWRAYLAGVRRFVHGPSSGATARPASAGRPMRRMPAAGVALGIVALLAIAAGVWWALTRAHGNSSMQATDATREGSVSLAVLPFVDLSPEKDQEYFSDGLSEELLNELAQIKDLRVAGRTSSFSFKGKNEDLRAIGKKLGVGNILEGSVRKSGNQLRITAQLINAADGTHRWSKSYDRELSNVFTVQEEIAMAVSAALSVTLDVGEMSRANGGTTNVAAYDKFLQAQALFYRGGQFEQFQQVSQRYREALALDPDFARAWYGLHRSLEQETVQSGDAAEAQKKEMQHCVERLMALSPKAWWTQSILTANFVRQRKWAEADAAISGALASSPRVELSLSYGIFLQRVGRGKEAVDYVRRAVEAEPLSRSLSLSLQTALVQAERWDEAAAEYQRGKTLGGTNLLADAFELWRLWSRKPMDKAAVEAQAHLVYDNLPPGAATGITWENWGNTPAAIAALRRSFEQNPSPGITYTVVADHYGQPDIVLLALRKALVERNGPQLFSLWTWNYSGWRSDPKFKDILRDLGLVDYFRSSGKWPDYCKPVGTNDFECH